MPDDSLLAGVAGVNGAMGEGGIKLLPGARDDTLPTEPNEGVPMEGTER